MKKWFYSGDVNWIDYGGTWFYRSSYENYYIAVEFLNWEDAVGSKEAKEIGSKYNVEVSYIDPTMYSFDMWRQALQFVGSLDKDANEITPQELIWALWSYGCKTVESSESGNNAYKMLNRVHCWPR